jgi:radical SAM protein with 4Fe4S-binding SPASM domain
MLDMTEFISRRNLAELKIWDKIASQHVPLDFFLEITARCNNDCRHCYINLPAGDREALRSELTLDEISDIADQAVALGSMFCLLTGGEPLLRKDFPEIYLALKRKGLLISIFTNACLVTEEHIALFKKYPPQYIEVSVYGATEETYERVTRKPGSYAAFRKGLDLLLKSGLKVRLKAMALRSNVHELPEIAEFCRTHGQGGFRFDPMLHLRYDRDPLRNEEIIQERLTPEEIVAIEQADEKRAEGLVQNCEHLIFSGDSHRSCNHLFHCGAGTNSFTVSYDGIFRLCADLWHPDTIYDLRKGTLAEAWNELVPRVRDMTSDSPTFLSRCLDCPIVNLCFWCPAHAYLECGELDCFVDYYCQVAHARAAAIRKLKAKS